MTLTEASAFLRLDRKTVVKLANAKQIPGRRLGRDWRFLRADLVRFVHGDRAA
jgi:excisionase family DNA binding protein